jgi:hypothetical protein
MTVTADYDMGDEGQPLNESKGPSGPRGSRRLSLALWIGAGTDWYGPATIAIFVFQTREG